LPARDAIDVRILADDLTGALDSAVAFSTHDRGVGVAWRRDASLGPRMAVDVSTREKSEGFAVARHASLARWLAGGELSFKKIDSLLRGHVLAEICACIVDAEYDRVVVAPAFPFQGRVTRAGRQWRLHPDTVVGPDLRVGLADRFQVSVARPGESTHGQVVVYDADTDADLDLIVSTELATPASILWIGAGGLASALARRLHVPSPAKTMLSGPFVGLVGTNHETTDRQIQRFTTKNPGAQIVIDGDLQSAKSRLIERMRSGRPSLVGVKAAGDRIAVAHRIDDTFAALLDGLPPPGVLFVTGGETLHAVCERLGAEKLVVESAIEPGLPVSRMCGGSFHGLVTISKSGAFGDADLLVRLSGDIAP
jgi:uncharacterized protein YgbK (DUF1537 family)